MVYPAQHHVLKTFEKLFELVPAGEKAKTHVLLLASEVTPFRHDTDREIAFRQESNFFYLSGCTIPGSYLLLSSQQGSTPKSQLFVPKSDPEDLMWSVPPPSLEAARETHDATAVRFADELADAIQSILTSIPDALFHTLARNSMLFPYLPEEHTVPILRATAITDGYLLSALHRARLTKDSAEIALIRKANAISSRAHEVVMRLLGKAVKGGIVNGEGAGTERPLLPGEWLIEKEAEAEAVFVASCRREGSVHQAYLPIVAASTRASTLHYCCNDREFAWGPLRPHDHRNRDDFARGVESSGILNPQVLLIDAGCEWNCHASDITRTMPVGNGGRFTTESGSIYDLVHEMQKVSFEILRPGLHWDAVQLLCHRTLVRGFVRLGIFRASTPEEDIVASGVSSAFFPHGVGHSLGLDVHDVPSASKPEKNETIGKGVQIGPDSFYTYLRLRLPLEEGMVVTVEPGIYFSPHLLAPHRNSPYIDHDVLQRYENVGGVRIEDVVLITKGGYENLTTVKSDREWVEGVCSGEI